MFETYRTSVRAIQQANSMGEPLAFAPATCSAYEPDRTPEHEPICGREELPHAGMKSANPIRIKPRSLQDGSRKERNLFPI